MSSIANYYYSDKQTGTHFTVPECPVCRHTST